MKEVGQDYEYIKAFKLALRLVTAEFHSKQQKSMLFKLERNGFCSDLIGRSLMQNSQIFNSTVHKYFDHLAISKIGFFSPDDFKVYIHPQIHHSKSNILKKLSQLESDNIKVVYQVQKKNTSKGNKRKESFNKLRSLLSNTDLLTKVRTLTKDTVSENQLHSEKLRKLAKFLMSLVLFDLVPYEKQLLSKVTGANIKWVTAILGLLQLRVIKNNHDTILKNFLNTFDMSEKVLIVLLIAARFLLPGGQYKLVLEKIFKRKVPTTEKPSLFKKVLEIKPRFFNKVMEIKPKL